MEDMKNNVSQELMAEHTSAYGNARITYRIYKTILPESNNARPYRDYQLPLRGKTTSRNGLSCPILPLS